MEKHTKKEALGFIFNSIAQEKNNKGRNSMGVSESFYNAYYLISRCFTTEELDELTESELNNLLKLAEFAGEAFY